MTETREYDIVIIGGGPAGLAAGLYAARGRHKTVLIEKGVVGGQIALTELVENYPGIPTVNGFDLAQTMLQQAESYGMETEYTEVHGIEERDRKWVVHTAEGDFVGKAVIVTAGAEYNKLGIPGEERLTGKGVSYCATCDAAFFKDMPVVVVGGGDAAMDEGIFTTRYASKATVVHRRDELRASAILQERALRQPEDGLHLEHRRRGDRGRRPGQEPEAPQRRDRRARATSPVDAIFIFIGQHPNTDFIGDLVPKDNGGHILVDEWMATPKPGLFAAGDVRQNSARQVASSVGDGVTAAIAADHYISANFHDESPSPKAEAQTAETPA